MKCWIVSTRFIAELLEMSYELVIIGCSLGGLNAMRVFLSELSTDHYLPIVLVQHRDKSPSMMLSKILQRFTHLQVEDADDRAEIRAGHLYIAPAGYHLLIERGCLSLSTELPVHHALPSIDVAFETAARSYGKNLVAIVLTSSSADGAEGAASVENRGGLLIVEDPLSAENATLPLSAIKRTKQPQIARLDEIPTFLNHILKFPISPLC